jgi:hypothetical protein
MHISPERINPACDLVYFCLMNNHLIHLSWQADTSSITFVEEVKGGFIDGAL